MDSTVDVKYLAADEVIDPSKVVVITNEHMKEVRDEARRRFLAEGRPANAISQISVQGYPGDERPAKNGINEIASIVRVLNTGKIPCCLVNEPALIYYGAGRVMSVQYTPSFRCR
jgi:hypothetical protein